MAHELACSANNFQAVRASIAAAIASAQMLPEKTEISVIQFGYRDTSLTGPMNDVFGASDMSTCGDNGITALKELFSESLEERSRRTTTDLQDTFRGKKVLRQHDGLPRNACRQAEGRHCYAEYRPSGDSRAAAKKRREVDTSGGHPVRITILAALNRGPDEWLPTFGDPMRTGRDRSPHRQRLRTVNGHRRRVLPATAQAAPGSTTDTRTRTTR